MKKLCLALLWLCGGLGIMATAQVPDSIAALQYPAPAIEHPAYRQMQAQLARGWNTWTNHSMLAQVLLPEGFSLHLGLKDRRLFGEHTREFYPMENEKPGYVVRPGKMRSIDGTYTEVSIEWNGIDFSVESATDGSDLYWLVTPKRLPRILPHLVLEAAMLWQMPGTVGIENGQLTARTGNKTIAVFSTATPITDLQINAFTPYQVFKLDGPIGICTGKSRTLAEIQQAIAKHRDQVAAQALPFGPLAEAFQATQAMMGWSTIYEPSYGRVVTPGAGRWWNKRFNNFALWGWDFTAMNCTLFGKEMAYINLLEILRHQTPEGFFPNYVMGYGIASRDRAQPPVYGMETWYLYQQFGDKWLLEVAYPYLLANNRWWNRHRQHQGFLCWGSSPVLMDWDAHTKKAAMFESGLDNSPMFDEAIFDTTTHLLMQADVGLMSFYIYDCERLADIAAVLGKAQEQKELKERADRYRKSLATLWHEASGLYLNKRLDTQQANPRISPANFYPLLLGLPSAQQARRMVDEHLLNPKEFYGTWMLPSVPRNDPAFPDQSYWRGRIWPPMNLLVYAGLKKYGFQETAAELSKKSLDLLMKGYKDGHWIRENFHADHGDGTPCTNKCFGGSDSYYTWGTLMAMPALMEAGHLPALHLHHKK